MPKNPEQNGRRDIIVIGGSVGALDPLKTIVKALPSQTGAAVFVVLHIPGHVPSLLPVILTRTGALSAVHPRHGDPIRPGRIYVAPPDKHMLIDDGKVVLSSGPTENRHRPAIDPLFRSAAKNYGSRVIGVVLSGARDDGMAGLMTIKKKGGLAVVQDPDDAVAPSMPYNAIRSAEPDHVLPASDIGPALLSALETALPNHLPNSAPSQPNAPAETAEPSPFGCPDCGGVLWHVKDENGVSRFRCRIGHGYSPASLASAQANQVEASLWAALRALEERASLAERLAERSQLHKSGLTRRFRAEAQSLRAQAATLRDFIHSLLEAPPAVEEQLEAAS